MKGAIVAVLVGVVGGGALYLYARKRADDGKSSPCKSACEIAMKVAGSPSDLGACDSYCGILDGLGGPVGAVKAVVNATPIVAAYNAFTKNDVCTTCCPPGAEAVVLAGQFAGQTVKQALAHASSMSGGVSGLAAPTPIYDHRTGKKLSGFGCRDQKTGAILGYLPAGGGFVPWAPTGSPPPPVTPVTQPGTTSTGARDHRH